MWIPKLDVYSHLLLVFSGRAILDIPYLRQANWLKCASPILSSQNLMTTHINCVDRVVKMLVVQWHLASWSRFSHSLQQQVRVIGSRSSIDACLGPIKHDVWPRGIGQLPRKPVVDTQRFMVRREHQFEDEDKILKGLITGKPSSIPRASVIIQFRWAVLSGKPVRLLPCSGLGGRALRGAMNCQERACITTKTAASTSCRRKQTSGAGAAGATSLTMSICPRSISNRLQSCMLLSALHDSTISDWVR